MDEYIDFLYECGLKRGGLNLYFSGEIYKGMFVRDVDEDFLLLLRSGKTLGYHEHGEIHRCSDIKEMYPRVRKFVDLFWNKQYKIPLFLEVILSSNYFSNQVFMTLYYRRLSRSTYGSEKKMLEWLRIVSGLLEEYPELFYILEKYPVSNLLYQLEKAREEEFNNNILEELRQRDVYYETTNFVVIANMRAIIIAKDGSDIAVSKNPFQVLYAALNLSDGGLFNLLKTGRMFSISRGNLTIDEAVSILDEYWLGKVRKFILKAKLIYG